MLAHSFQGLVGFVLLLAGAYALSNNRKRIDWRPVIGGLFLQIMIALVILKTSQGRWLFEALSVGVSNLMSFADVGIAVLLQSHETGKIEPAVNNLVFKTLTTVIFFSALLSVLYHLGIMQVVVKCLAFVMQRTMGTSGAETLSSAANIFVGQTEAPLLVKPYLREMTRSELFAVMTGGFATIAGGVMAIYAAMLHDIPNILSHLLTASAMNAPAGLVFAKLMYPETEVSKTKDASNLPMPRTSTNILEAIGNGAIDGLRLVAYMAAMLLAFSALVAMLNAGLLACGLWTLEESLGKLFRPLAWSLGTPWDESETLGRLLGKRMALNEFLAYQDLQKLRPSLTPRTALIASYALCGFANLASIGVQIGGIGAMAPERKSDLAELAFKAMLAGTFASWLTACVAGLLMG